MLSYSLITFGVALCIVGSVMAQPTLPPNPNMFEISTRPWLYSLSQKYGRDISTLAAIPDAELKTFADRGINVLWFMGIWSLGIAIFDNVH